MGEWLTSEQTHFEKSKWKVHSLLAPFVFASGVSLVLFPVVVSVYALSDSESQSEYRQVLEATRVEREKLTRLRCRISIFITQ